jgi:hypothetical protein
MKLKLLPMTETFAAYNAGEESNAVMSAELLTVINGATANKEAAYSDILLAVASQFIEGVHDGRLIYSPTNKATHGVNYVRICEALLTLKFERGEVKAAAKDAHFEFYGEKLNPGFLGRVGESDKPKPKPSFAKVKSAIDRQTKTAASLTGSKDKAEALAAAKLLVAALSV